MTTDLVVTDQTVFMPAMTMSDAAARFNALAHFAKQIMVAGTDYGIIPGASKATLLKAGAEKLTTFFGLRAVPVLVEKTEDWTGVNHGGEPFFHYWFRYELYRGTTLIAAADGACNSWESKYRYRQGERKCPKCGASAIIRGKQEYGGGWLCFGKRGGCGAKFKDGDPAIEGQQVGRVVNPDPADIANTVLKMAQKRALVAATLLAVNASEYFTQDLEDIVDVIDVTPTPPAPEPAKPAPTPTNGDMKPAAAPALARPLAAEAIRDVCRRKAGWNSGVRAMGKTISEGQVVSVATLMETALHVDGMASDILNHQRHDVLDYLYGVRSTGALTTGEASAIISWLKSADDGNWELNEYARAEIAAVVSAVAVAAGQQVLL